MKYAAAALAAYESPSPSHWSRRGNRIVLFLTRERVRVRVTLQLTNHASS
jgi:hypothetical protein